MAEDQVNNGGDSNPQADQQAGQAQPRQEPPAGGAESAGTGSGGQGNPASGAQSGNGPEEGGSSGVDLSDFASQPHEDDAAPWHDGVEQEREREAILDVPVKITAVVGDVKMPVRDLVRLGRGAVVPLNRKLGASIDIYANDRLIARGEITIIEDDNIAVTMTEIMSSSASS